MPFIDLITGFIKHIRFFSEANWVCYYLEQWTKRTCPDARRGRRNSGKIQQSSLLLAPTFSIQITNFYFKCLFILLINIRYILFTAFIFSSSLYYSSAHCVLQIPFTLSIYIRITFLQYKNVIRPYFYPICTPLECPSSLSPHNNVIYCWCLLIECIKLFFGTSFKWIIINIRRKIERRAIWHSCRLLKRFFLIFSLFIFGRSWLQ